MLQTFCSYPVTAEDLTIDQPLVLILTMKLCGNQYNDLLTGPLVICTVAHPQEPRLHGDTSRTWNYPQVNSLCDSANWSGSFRFHFLSCPHPSSLSCSFTFSPTVQLQELVSDFSISFFSSLVFCDSPTDRFHIQLQNIGWNWVSVTSVTCNSEDGCWFAPATFAEIFVSWSHSAADTRCSYPSPLSGRIFLFHCFDLLTFLWHIAFVLHINTMIAFHSFTSLLTQRLYMDVSVSCITRCI